jgi:uncharacterized membrane protein
MKEFGIKDSDLLTCAKNYSICCKNVLTLSERRYSQETVLRKIIKIRLISFGNKSGRSIVLKKTAGRKRFETRQIAIVGMLSAISIVLGASGVGFIPLPMAKATIMHIPVIIGAILEGPLVGMAAGLIFGVFSIIQNLTNPSLLSFAFLNPLVSVLPRVLIGITTHYSHKIPFIKSKVIKIGVSAVVGTLTNTVGVLGMIYLLYAAEYAQANGIDVSKAAAAIFGVAATNAPAEMIVSVALSIPIVLAVRKILKK